MKKTGPEDREEALRKLEAARETFEVLRGAVLATVRRLQSGEDMPEAGKVRSSAADFARALNQVMEIENGLAKHSGWQNGGGTLDLADARREVLERLARRAGRG